MINIHSYLGERGQLSQVSRFLLLRFPGAQIYGIEIAGSRRPVSYPALRQCGCPRVGCLYSLHSPAGTFELSTSRHRQSNSHPIPPLLSASHRAHPSTHPITHPAIHPILWPEERHLAAQLALLFAQHTRTVSAGPAAPHFAHRLVVTILTANDTFRILFGYTAEKDQIFAWQYAPAPPCASHLKTRG